VQRDSKRYDDWKARQRNYAAEQRHAHAIRHRRRS
jgi:hypothetical protein